jgi:hypothetical protein
VEGRKEDWCCLCSSNGVVEEKEEEKVLDDSGPWESVGVGVGGGKVSGEPNHGADSWSGEQQNMANAGKARLDAWKATAGQDPSKPADLRCNSIRYDTIRYGQKAESYRMVPARLKVWRREEERRIRGSEHGQKQSLQTE